MFSLFSRRTGLLPVTLCCLVSSAVLAEDTVTFTYNPPDGLTYEVKLEAVQKKEAQASGKSQILTEEMKLRKAVTIKKNEAGWSEFHDVSDLSLFRNGRKVGNPLISATLKRSLEYRINQDGKIQDVVGFEGVLDELKDKIPEQVLEKIARAVSAERLKAKEMTEWNGRFGGLAGKTVEIGSEETKVSPFQLPTGDTVEFETVTRYLGWEKCGDKDCFRIEQEYSGDLEAAAETILEKAHKMTQGLRENSDTDMPEDVEAMIEGKTEILLDPATLLPYREVQNRFIRMVANIPGQGIVPVEQTARKTLQYSY
ncbi:hypothetical protein BTA51_15685 [Hahella sp. CCB-MM4]|uniref:hypothetical protein n=1 Tax=Hahella sp. (strain CCB-MM4) TaxID=1926491 RepID=UPI000B9A4767|nr:hypothetical protein [Hahella sp. CCB-MM4]OZG72556.1 hypothetical protein BTA51_15685 [Hahella sp. CCB-MM4]